MSKKGMNSKKKPVSDASESSESSALAQLRDLVVSAGSVLSGLSVDAPEASADAPAEQEEAAKAKPAKRGKSRSQKKSAVESIEWQTETANLEIIDGGAQASELTEQSADEAADDDALTRFEALAKRVAQTVNKRKSSVPENEPEAEPKNDIEASTLKSDEETPIEGVEEMEIEAASNDDVSSEGEIEPDSESEIETEGELAPADGEIEAEFSASAIDSEAADNAEIADAATSMEQIGFSTLEATKEGGAEELVAETEAETETEAESGDESDEMSADAGADEAAHDSAGAAEGEQPSEFFETDQVASIIESVLFSTDKPISVTTIKQMFKGSNIRTKDITRALEILASEYASPVRGVTLEEVHGGYQLRTKADNADYLRRLAKVRPFRLSGPALEVMAMVAYKQPITKHEIDEIRGVESGHLLRALMERGLVHFEGKSELPGKPMNYGTTRKFLETFGLRNIKELPTLSQIDELLPEGIGEVEEKETLSDITEQMSQHVATSYSEGEDELSKINDSLKTIDTTTEFFEQEKVRERERRDRERAQDIREKIVLGDPVEAKDKRWLDRYEAKLAAGSAAPVPEEVAPEAEDGAQFSEQLEALTEDAEAKDENAGVDDELAEVDPSMMATEDDDQDVDDLTGNIDWDDESESGKDA